MDEVTTEEFEQTNHLNINRCPTFTNCLNNMILCCTITTLTSVAVISNSNEISCISLFFIALLLIQLSCGVIDNTASQDSLIWCNKCLELTINDNRHNTNEIHNSDINIDI